MTASQDHLYLTAAHDYSAALERLARVYEADVEKRRDLLQDINVALWRSFAKFNGACSMRTWVFRVAHNTAVSHVVREKRRRPQSMLDLEEIEQTPGPVFTDQNDRRQQVEQLLSMIRKLKPIDRQVVLAYLEDMDAAGIAEMTGLSAGNVATKIHRIKRVLAKRFRTGDRT